MSNVVISGYYGSRNAGDEAMLAAMLEVFSDMDPKVNITVISSTPEDTTSRHGVRSIGWLDFPAIYGQLKSADLLISGGGSLLQNVTSRRSLYYYMVIIWMAIFVNTPVMLYAQGIGPIRGSLARSIMCWLGNRVNMITVRDKGSLRELDSLGITVPYIEAAADPVLAIHKVDLAIGRSILESSGISGAKPIIGIAVREWCGLPEYKTTVAIAADRIAEELKAQIVFLPMQYPDDVRTAEYIAGMTHCQPAVLNADYTTTELLSIVGNMDLLVSIRLHALIFAGVMGVPMVGISYDPKIDRFLECLGDEPAGNVEKLDIERLMAAVHLQWKNRSSFRAKNTELFSGLRNMALRNAELAFSVLNAK